MSLSIKKYQISFSSLINFYLIIYIFITIEVSVSVSFITIEVIADFYKILRYRSNFFSYKEI